jgi:prepilin-type N-terminal cleavage/methylation domain-containing protein
MTLKIYTSKKKTIPAGFTIVELLVVIVVIAILAAITMAVNNSVRQRAADSAVQAIGKEVATSIALYQVENSAYPPSLSALGMDSKLFNGSTVWAYTATSSSYCLSMGSTKSSSTFYVSNTMSTVTAGLCPGHSMAMLGNTDTGAGSYPSRDGYVDVTTATYAGDNTEVSIGSIPVGSWMLAVFAYNNNEDPIQPGGWTELITRHSTNTLQTSIYAKIKESGDVSQQLFNAGGVNGEPTTNGVILWGSNSDTVSAWGIGSFGDRGSNASSTTTVTPAVSTTISKSLILSISTERTAASESIYTSLTGVSPWIWIPQPNTNKINTIAIGYETKDTPGVSQVMTTTYPNVQTLNGFAVQIVIPPAR